MSLTKAIKRSYRFFIPPSLRTPRKFVLRYFEPFSLYFIGLTTGMYVYARPGESDHITNIAIVGSLVLLALKWWSGARPLE